MSYLVTELWKLPKLARQQLDADQEPSGTPDGDLLAAACRDCGHYNFPPRCQCRACGSPRTETVSLSSEHRPNPGALVFGTMNTADTSDKPN